MTIITPYVVYFNMYTKRDRAVEYSVSFLFITIHIMYISSIVSYIVLRSNPLLAD